MGVGVGGGGGGGGVTLQMFSLVTKMFLAAKSLWMKCLLERYCIPRAICWE